MQSSFLWDVGRAHTSLWCEASGPARVRTRVPPTVFSHSCVDGFISFPLSPSSPSPLISRQFFILIPFLLSSLSPPSPLSVPSCLYCLISPSILHLLSPLSSDLISTLLPLLSSCFLCSCLFPSPLSPFSNLYVFWFLLMHQFLLCPNQMLHTVRESVKCRCYTWEGNVASARFSQKEKRCDLRSEAKGTPPLFLPPSMPLDQSLAGSLVIDSSSKENKMSCI